MILLLLLSLTCTTRGQTGSEPTGSGLSSDTLIPSTQSVCPFQKAKEDFDMSKVYIINNFVLHTPTDKRHNIILHNNIIFCNLQFLGKWYVLEYIYDKPKTLKAFGCISFDFSMTADGDLKSNFTFKFPAKTGFYYHVPSYSPVNTIIPAIWDTKHKGGKNSRIMTFDTIVIF